MPHMPMSRVEELATSYAGKLGLPAARVAMNGYGSLESRFNVVIEKEGIEISLGTLPKRETPIVHGCIQYGLTRASLLLHDFIGPHYIDKDETSPITAISTEAIFNAYDEWTAAFHQTMNFGLEGWRAMYDAEMSNRLTPLLQAYDDGKNELEQAMAAIKMLPYQVKGCFAEEDRFPEPLAEMAKPLEQAFRRVMHGNVPGNAGDEYVVLDWPQRNVILIAVHNMAFNYANLALSVTRGEPYLHPKRAADNTESFRQFGLFQDPDLYALSSVIEAELADAYEVIGNGAPDDQAPQTEDFVM